MALIDQQKSAQMIAALDPFHTQVGRIASQWATLDHTIDQAIWRLAELPSSGLGACITSQLTSTSARLRVLVALLSMREGSDALVRKVNAFTQKMYVPLNRAVHDSWTVTDSGEVAQIRVALVKGELKFDTVPVLMPEMLEALKAVSRQMQNFNTLYHELAAWLGSYPQKWREPPPQISIGQSVDVTP